MDGVPLTRVLAIGNNATLNAVDDAPTTARISGQYELVNSHDIVMRFKMTDPNYVGTPNITLVSPEKSSPLNFFGMKINGLKYKTSLDKLSIFQPMFVENFRIDRNLQIESKTWGYVKARLKGAGLRRNANIWVDGVHIPYKSLDEVRIKVAQASPNVILHPFDAHVLLYRAEPFVTQNDTGEYLMYFRDPIKKLWPIKYRHATNRGFEADEFNYKDSKAGDIVLVSYTPNPTKKKSIVDVRVFGSQPSNPRISPTEFGRPVTSSQTVTVSTTGRNRRGQTVTTSRQVRRQGPFIQREGEDQWRLLFEVDYENNGTFFAERESVSISVDQDGKTNTQDIALRVRPQITAITVSKPPTPEADGSIITIDGINLQSVVKVLVMGQETDIISEPSKEWIMVKLKKGAFIKEEDGVKIPVVLITSDDIKASGIVTIGAPKPAATGKKKGKGKK